MRFLVVACIIAATFDVCLAIAGAMELRAERTAATPPLQALSSAETQAASNQDSSEPVSPLQVYSEHAPDGLIAAKESLVEPVTINLLMVGDFVLHNAPVQSSLREDGSYDFMHHFEHVAGEVSSADLAIINQETPIGGEAVGWYGWRDLTTYVDPDTGEAWTAPFFNSPDAVADAEAAVGFDVILKAENHIFDQGYDAVAHELSYWTEHYPEISVIGVSDPYGESGAPDYVNDVYIYEKDGFKIGVLNFTDITNGSGGDRDYDVCSYISEEKIISDIQKARDKGADMIVACPHWGTEYQVYADEYEVYFAHFLAEQGVDVIFGTHPHCLQNIEVLSGPDGKPCVCFYSNGNFTTEVAVPDCMMCGISEAQVQKSPDGHCSIVSARMIPCVVFGTWSPAMSTYPLSEWTDELAAESWLPWLTPDYAKNRCYEIFGDGFDFESCIYNVQLP